MNRQRDRLRCKFFSGQPMFTTVVFFLLMLSTGCASRQLRKASEVNSVQAYKQFIIRFPDKTAYIKEAEDRLKFLIATEDDSVESYRGYLEEYPDGIFRQEAKAHIHYLNIIEDEAEPVVILAMLKQFVEENDGLIPITWEMSQFLDNLYFINQDEIVLVAEKRVSSSNFRPLGINVYSSSTYEVYAGAVFLGEIVYKCNYGQMVRTLYSFRRSQIKELKDGEKVELVCGEKEMVEYLAGDEAFGEPKESGNFGTLFTDRIPDQLAQNYAPSREVGERTHSSGVLNDVVGAAASFSVEHPIATEIIVEGIKRRYDRNRD